MNNETLSTRYAMIEELVNHSIQNMNDEKLKNVLINGFSGFTRYTNNQLQEMLDKVKK